MRGTAAIRRNTCTGEVTFLSEMASVQRDLIQQSLMTQSLGLFPTKQTVSNHLACFQTQKLDFLMFPMRCRNLTCGNTETFVDEGYAASANQTVETEGEWIHS